MVITRIFNCEFYLTRPQSSLLRNERSARGDGKEEKGRQTTGDESGILFEIGLPVVSATFIRAGSSILWYAAKLPGHCFFYLGYCLHTGHSIFYPPPPYTKEGRF